MEKKCKVLAIVWDVIVGAATVQALVFFAVPSTIMGSELDMRFMLWFAAAGVLGAVLLTLAARGYMYSIWAALAFMPPAYLSLYWGQILFTPENFSLFGIVMFGLPIVAYTGGLIVSADVFVRQLKLKKKQHEEI